MLQIDSNFTISDLVIRTRAHQWVIPYNCEILKALLAEQDIHAVDLQFSSEIQCRGFIKRLLLLAAQDECRHRSPSRLAFLARELINHKPKPIGVTNAI